MTKTNSRTITVIVPVYNVEHYLEACLLSLLHQSVPFDEVILINDGSTDSSVQICEKYILGNDTFLLINQENQGLSCARNVGIKNATSEYILFLDSDDCLNLDACKTLKHYLDNYDVEAFYFDADIFGNTSSISNYYDRGQININLKPQTGFEFFKEIFPYYYVTSACLALYKKAIILKCNLSFPEGIYFEDNYFTFVFMCNADTVLYIPKKLYLRRYRENSITTSPWTKQKFQDRNTVVILIYHYISQMINEKISVPQEFMLRYISSILRSNLDLMKLLEVNGILQDGIELLEVKESIHLYYKLLMLLKYQCNYCKLETVLNITECLCKIEQERIEPVTIAPDFSVKHAVSVLRKQYTDILIAIPLGEDTLKIGLYGTGKHAAGLLNMYEKLIGEIKCELVFIDSVKEEGFWHGRKIVNYRCIDESFHEVVICSYLYREQMRNNLTKLKINIVINDYNEFLEDDIFQAWNPIECLI